MDLRIDLHHTDWLHELVFPLLFFSVPLAISLVWTGDVLIAIAPAMLLSGYLFAPRHLWPIWLGAIALLWAVQGAAALTGEFASDPQNGETFWSFAAESLVLTVVLVLVPVWLGKKLRQVRTRSTPG